MEKMAWDGPKWGQEDFFLLIQTLLTFGAERIFILVVSFLGCLQIPGFPIRFPDSQIQGCQLACLREESSGPKKIQSAWFSIVNIDSI